MFSKLVIVAVFATIGLVNADCPSVIPNPLSECSSPHAVCEYSVCPDDVSQQYQHPWNARCYCLLLGTVGQSSQNVDLWSQPPGRPVFTNRWICASADCNCPASVEDNSDCGVSLSAAAGLPNTFRGDWRVAGQTGCRYPVTMSDGLPGEKVCKCSMYNGDGWIWQCARQHL